MAKYDKPGWFRKSVGNAPIALLVKLGFSPAGAHLLAVRGRKSGEWRTTPINPLEHEGGRYLVAPRGETEWVRNMRAAGGGELRLGSKREAIQAVELADEDKPALIHAYLKRWRRETGAFFDNISDDAPDEEYRRIAPDHPTFRITTTDA